MYVTFYLQEYLNINPELKEKFDINAEIQEDCNINPEPAEEKEVSAYVSNPSMLGSLLHLGPVVPQKGRSTFDRTLVWY